MHSTKSDCVFVFCASIGKLFFICVYVPEITERSAQNIS